MSYGIQIIDASGNISITDRLTRFINTYTFTIPANIWSINISVPSANAVSWAAIATKNCIAVIVTDNITIYRPLYQSQYDIVGTVNLIRY